MLYWFLAFELGKGLTPGPFKKKLFEGLQFIEVFPATRWEYVYSIFFLINRFVQFLFQKYLFFFPGGLFSTDVCSRKFMLFKMMLSEHSAYVYSILDVS